MTRKKSPVPEMTAEQIERMRPLWDAADRAIRADVAYSIEFARAYHHGEAVAAGQSARRLRERY